MPKDKDYYQVAVNNVLSKKFRTYKSAIKYIDKNEECFTEDGYMKDNVEIIYFLYGFNKTKTRYITRIFDDDLDILY